MTDNIEVIAKRVQKCLKFRAQYPEAPGTLEAKTCELSIAKRDCALAGKVFGKEGWKRKVSWGKDFNWVQTIDEIEITIHEAEPNEFVDTPVPPKAFPIQLEDKHDIGPIE